MRYNGNAFTARDLENYIENFDYNALQDNTKEGYKYKLELAWSRVVAKTPADVIYYNNIY